MCYSYFRSYGLDVTIVRPFNIFGVRQKAGRFGALIPRLVRQGINGEGLTIFGAGSATRDYLYVSDIVGAYNLVLRTPTLRGQAINFASGKDTRVRDIVEYVADKFGARIEHRDARPGEVQRFPADISLAKASGSSRKSKFGTASIAISIGPRISPNTHMSRTGLAVPAFSNTPVAAIVCR